jgi:flagellin
VPEEIMALNGITGFGASMAIRNLQKSNAGFALALARLSAGQRVLASRDDAASLAIGSRLGAETSALLQAQLNTGQASSMLQVADGGMARIGEALTRMKALAVQAGSGTLSAADRSALDTEFQALASEIDRIAADTEFAGTNLLDGSVPVVDFKVGTGTDPAADGISVGLDRLSLTALSLDGANVATTGNADAALLAINNAIDTIQVARTQIGADQSRLDIASAHIATTFENTEAARSGLIDLDIASGTADLAIRSMQMAAGLFSLDQKSHGAQHLVRLLS